MRLSIIVEWANTRLNGTPRAWRMLDILARQWQELAAKEYPAGLTPEAVDLLNQLDPRPELIIVTGTAADADLDKQIRSCLPEYFEIAVHHVPGLEYYPLKNFGSRLATADLLLFVDSDVIPEDGWLAHLVGSLAHAEVGVVSGQTYVAPVNLFSRAFALGWTYALRDDRGQLVQPKKFYANNILFRREIFELCGFPAVGNRSRGACSLLRQQLGQHGIEIWENRGARVDHPPPSNFRHLVVRALAHGRDHYMKLSEQRSFRNLARSVAMASWRLAFSFYRTFRDWRQVGLRRIEIPAALAIVSGYYFFFALGGVLTHVSPRAMGKRFRV